MHESIVLTSDSAVIRRRPKLTYRTPAVQIFMKAYSSVTQT